MNKQTTTKTINTASAFGATEEAAPAERTFTLSSSVASALMLSGAASAGLFSEFKADLHRQSVTSADFATYWKAQQSLFNKQGGTTTWRDTTAAKLSSALKGCLLAADAGYKAWQAIPKNKAEDLLSGKAFVDGQAIVYKAKEDLQAAAAAKKQASEEAEAAEAAQAAATAQALRQSPAALLEALTLLTEQVATGQPLTADVDAAIQALGKAYTARSKAAAAASRAAAASQPAEPASVLSDVVLVRKASKVSKARKAAVQGLHADRAAASVHAA